MDLESLWQLTMLDRQQKIQLQDRHSLHGSKDSTGSCLMRWVQMVVVAKVHQIIEVHQEERKVVNQIVQAVQMAIQQIMMEKV